MLFRGNYHYQNDFFNHHTRFFEENEVLLLNPSPDRFATHFLQIMHTLRLKNSLRGTVQLQEFVALRLRKEEVTGSMIKEDKSFHQRHILVKIENPLLVLLKDGRLKPSPYGQSLVHGPYG